MLKVQNIGKLQHLDHEFEESHKNVSRKQAFWRNSNVVLHLESTDIQTDEQTPSKVDSVVLWCSTGFISIAVEIYL